MLCISGNIDLSTQQLFLLKVRKVKQKKKRMPSSLMRFQIKNEFMIFQNGKLDQIQLMILFAQYQLVTTVLLSVEIQVKF